MKNTILAILLLVAIVAALLFGAMKFADAVHAMVNENALRVEQYDRF